MSDKRKESKFITRKIIFKDGTEGTISSMPLPPEMQPEGVSMETYTFDVMDFGRELKEEEE